MSNFDDMKRERTRAERAEKHLRECKQALLRTADLIESTSRALRELGGCTDPEHVDEFAAELRAVAAARTPESCGVKMSHYGTCLLGTYGCISDHTDERPTLLDRLVVSASKDKP